MADKEDKVSSSQIQFSQSDLPELLQQYYKRLFPYKYYYQWLSYGCVPKNYFQNREFSFTLKDDIYVRYQSFSSQEEMEKEIQKRNPYKIDIGAVFTHKPKDHKMIKAASFQAVEKELVFDIDMTDYDEIRTCCKGAEICPKCWTFMVVAMKILDKALKDDFGFQHRLWVYSGRRGVHCWVCDEAARKLSQSARSAVAEYLSVVKGGDSKTKKVNLRSPLHPHLQRSEKVVKKYFVKHILSDQEILSCKERWDGVLALIPDDSIKAQLEKEWSSSSESTLDRWKYLKEGMQTTKISLKDTETEIMFQYTYPRLDVNVTKGLNHLLKSPFCIHPKTGRVCVPIDIDEADSFDPFTVPTISQLLEEIDDYDMNNLSESMENNTAEKKKKFPAYEKTSLFKAVKTFQKFLKPLNAENDKRRKMERNEEEKKCDW
ncbi:DNA primase small subunit-like [Actinia tenebrosa]|uniref:DNA primase n=1 Tax=Actinia tenebrosa TaxID=6105 RepID=A0A6P8I3H7_ACTTE|nr:DNA primase small subunit-like [Actinia tenebrosa]